MSINKKIISEIFADFAKELDVDVNKLWKIAGSRIPQGSVFTAKARVYAEEHNLKESDIPHTGDKITLDDVRAALGEEKKSKSGDAFTAKARTLAKENKLTEKDFPVESRTGKTRKTGVVEITVKDVKAKLGLEDDTTSVKISPTAKILIKELKLDSTKIKGSGKDGRILKSDVEEFIKESEESEDESEEEEE